MSAVGRGLPSGRTAPGGPSGVGGRTGRPSASPDALPQEIEAAVRAHPQVERLDAGPLGTVASHLPGRRRVLGVRLAPGGGRVELAVVARLGLPLPQLATELAAAVRALLPGADVDVTITDVVPGLAAVPPGPRPTR